MVDVDFLQEPGGARRATCLHVEAGGGSSTIVLGDRDFTFLTLGSITADSRLGGTVLFLLSS